MWVGEETEENNKKFVVQQTYVFLSLGNFLCLVGGNIFQKCIFFAVFEWHLAGCNLLLRGGLDIIMLDCVPPRKIDCWHIVSHKSIVQICFPSRANRMSFPI